jgi:predicted enzyme related to lactoylglutathione lyase
MELVQARIVTDDVEGIAAFYARLTGNCGPLNSYYVEVPAGAITVGFSKCRFTHYQEDDGAPVTGRRPCRGEIMLDFLADDVNDEYQRIAAIGVEWVMPPRIQPWGGRSIIFRDPEGHLINVFSRD